MLVDDEILVLEGLKKAIDWEEQGFTIVGQALNGLEAYKEIDILKPDVVFTDIRMPGMNGIDLMDKFQLKEDKLKFVIFSGYEDFSYAQKAMNLGAVGYCLKPFNEEEILNTLNNVKKALKGYDKLVKAELLELLDWCEYRDDKIIESALGMLGFNWNTSIGAFFMTCIGNLNMDIKIEGQYIKVKTGIEKNTYLIDGSIRNSVINLFKSNLPYGIKGIGIGKIVYSVHELKNALDDATVMAYSYFTTNKAKAWYGKIKGENDQGNFLAELDSYIKTNNTDSIKSLFKNIYSQFISKENSILYLNHLYNSIMFHTYSEYIYSYEQLADMFTNIESVFEYLENVVIDYLHNKNNKNDKDEETNNKALNSILAYINNYYFNDISIKDLASRFYVHPNYISFLFKKELNITFSQYLLKIRINYAVELLTGSNLSISDIAKKIGYNDYFYFAKVFKKHMGKTPSHYRSSDMEGKKCLEY